MVKYMIVALLVITGIAVRASRENYSPENFFFDHGCRCVPQHICERDTSEEGLPRLISIRYKTGPCLHYLEKCCDDFERPYYRNPVLHGCGNRNDRGINIAIMDKEEETEFAEFPWVVGIFDKTDTDQYKCAGSLIHPQVILTAAHCVAGRQAPSLIVRAGEWDTKTTLEPLPHQERSVSGVIIHENYLSTPTDYLKNDFALVILSQPFSLDENVNTVCLPDSNSVNHFDFNSCFVAGWGKNNFEDRMKNQVIMKVVHTFTLSDNQCKNSLWNTLIENNLSLDASLTCAGGEARDPSHKMEEGAPLVCALRTNRQRYEQAGFVAWSASIGQNGLPVAYANVAHVRNWIDNQMALMKFDASYYIDHQPRISQSPGLLQQYSRTFGNLVKNIF